MLFYSLFRSMLHLIQPIVCPVCGQLGEPLCHECAAKMLSCHEFKYKKFNLYAAANYDSDIKPIILKLKYNALKAAGKILGAETAKIFKKPDADILVPVPLHIGSKRKYNQAFEIALGLGSEWGINAYDICRWTTIISSRVGLNISERKSLTPDVFKIKPNKEDKIEIKGLKIALVDDVCTTGSTLECLAEACEQAGAHVVAAYVIAKA